MKKSKAIQKKSIKINFVGQPLEGVIAVVIFIYLTVLLVALFDLLLVAVEPLPLPPQSPFRYHQPLLHLCHSNLGHHKLLSFLPFLLLL